MDDSWFRIFLKGAGVFCVSIVCAGVLVAVILLLANRELHAHVARALGLAATADSIQESVQPKVHPEEKGTAESNDHYAVVRRVLACTGIGTIAGLARLPPADRLVYTENPRLLKLAREEIAGAPAIRPTNGAEQATMELSRALFNQRGRLRERADSAYSTWQITALVTIGLGLLTTVMVGLTATEYGKGDSRWPATIRVVAIILPALGTAAASVSAFYGPQAEWAQASRSLASVSHLHNQIAMEFWRIDCISSDGKESQKPQEAKSAMQDSDAKSVRDTKDSKISKDAKLELEAKLEAWAIRYADIQAAIAAPSQSGPTNGNDTPSQGAGKK